MRKLNGTNFELDEDGETGGTATSHNVVSYNLAQC